MFALASAVGLTELASGTELLAIGGNVLTFLGANDIINLTLNGAKKVEAKIEDMITHDKPKPKPKIANLNDLFTSINLDKTPGVRFPSTNLDKRRSMIDSIGHKRIPL